MFMMKIWVLFFSFMVMCSLTASTPLNKLIVHNVLPVETTVIMQVGQPRTASTFQWYLICSAMRILHGPGQVDCGMRAFTADMKPVAKYYVGKTHDCIAGELGLISKIWGGNTSDYVSVFISQNGMKKTPQNPIMDVSTTWLHTQMKRATLVATADIIYTVERGALAVYDYAHLFNLTVNQTHELYQHMRYWDILRVCCGYQQSKYNRAITHHRAELYDESFMLPDYPACEIYNLKKAEEAFLATKLAKTFPDDLYIISRGGKSSGYITPGFCESEEKRLAKNPVEGWN